jgi:hypothetical protein
MFSAWRGQDFHSGRQMIITVIHVPNRMPITAYKPYVLDYIYRLYIGPSSTYNNWKFPVTVDSVYNTIQITQTLSPVVQNNWTNSVIKKATTEKQYHKWIRVINYSFIITYTFGHLHILSHYSRTWVLGFFVKVINISFTLALFSAQIKWSVK